MQLELGLDIEGITSDPEAKRVKQLYTLIKLYERGFVSSATAKALDQLLQLETHLLLNRVQKIDRDLQEFEERYGFKSDVFFDRYHSCMMDDSIEFIEWMSLIHMSEMWNRFLCKLTDD